MMAKKFGADRIMYSVVTTTSCFMANGPKWPPRHGQVVQ